MPSATEDNVQFEVVISGISGKFPGSDSLEDLKDNLLKKTDVISKDEYRRINTAIDSVTPYIGKISDLDKFDDSFFGVPYRLAELMDPLTRITIERAYEAIFDAGINPQTIKETNTAVYTASCISDSEAAGIDDLGQTQYWLLAHIRALLANRISYFLNLNGPSWTIDGSWSGGFDCLKHAVHDIRIGKISAALVGVTNVIIAPEITSAMRGLGKFAKDDKCKPFDESADGYVRSEGVVMLYLQRAVDAKRSYGTIIHADATYQGCDQENFLKPASRCVTEFLRKFYRDCKIPTKDVAYVEADGSGQKYMDQLEANVLADVFCDTDERKGPLLIGSVKSHLGHTEGASCLISLAKALIALDTGVIPPDAAHFQNHNKVIRDLFDNQLKIVLEPTQLPAERYVGVNCFGLSNSLGHVLLKQHAKQKVKPSEQLPTLVIVSARNEQGILRLINTLESVPYDPEYFWLANEIFREPVKAHFYKGFAILGSTEKKIHFSLEVQPSGKRPVWYVFDGMGSQWPGMGSELMALPVFAKAIDECHDYLLPFGVNLKNVITSFDPTVLEDSVNSFIGIMAIQIGMVDVLRELGIEPDGMIGHSLGETGCAYADGCLNRYQTIMAAYYRGFATKRVQMKKGLMAAVGTRHDKLTDLPDGVLVACRNAEDSCTISGPVDAVEDYMNELKRQGIFVRKVNSNNVAFHSPLVKPLADFIHPLFKGIMAEPKKRSKRWISTSIEEKNWNSNLAATCSAEYQLNNFLNTVYFNEACKKIPEDAVVLEIAPHGLFQGILKRALHESCFNIPLGKRESSSPLNFLLSAIGKLYVAGLQPNVNALYPKIQYPVSRGTPSLANFITWNHEKVWDIKIKKEQLKIRPLEINICKKEHRFIANHRIADRILLPIPLLLLRTVKAFEPLTKDADILTFENVFIQEWPEITVENPITIQTQVIPGSGNFEILNNDHLLISGNVRFSPSGSSNQDVAAALENLTSSDYVENDDIIVHFEHSEIYKIFQENEFSFTESYSWIKKISFTSEGCTAEVIWKNDISVFLYTLLQMKLFYCVCLQEEKNGLPTAFLKFEMNKTYFDGNFNFGDIIAVKMNRNANVIWGRNFQLIGVRNSPLIRLPTADRDVSVGNLQFIPYSKADQLDIEEFLEICSKIIADSLNVASVVGDATKSRTLNVYEINERTCAECTKLDENLQILYEYLREQRIEVSVCNLKNIQSIKTIKSNVQNLIVFPTNDPIVATDALSELSQKSENAFVLSCFDNNDLDVEYPSIVTKSISPNLRLGLRRKKVDVQSTVLKINPEENPRWLDDLEDDLYSIKSDEVLTVLWHSKYLTEASNNLESIFKLDIYHKIRIVIVLGGDTTTFSLNDHKKQLEKNLTVNVLKDGQWGVLTYLRVNLFKSEADTAQKLSLRCSRINGIVAKFVAIPKCNYSEDRNSGDAQDTNWVEFSGIKLDGGERVMGIVDLVSLKNEHSIVEPIVQWPVPQAWSLEDAATVPLAYSKVYYALLIRGNLRTKSKVLIHSGHTSLGEAAIRVSLGLDCTVYTTAYNADGAKLITRKFKDSKLVQVLILNDDGISTEILKLTDGRGVDLVTNAITEKQIQESVKCLIEYGSLVQLSEGDIKSTTRIGTECFLKCTNIIGCTGFNLLKDKPRHISELQRLMSDGIANKIVIPLDKEIRQLATDISFAQMNLCQPTTNGNNNVYPDDRLTYLIIGNKCALWYSVVFWLLQQRNAKKIIFAIDDETENGHQHDNRFDLLLLKYRNISTAYTSIETLMQSFEQISDSLTLDIVFCINADGQKLREIDSVSRQPSCRRMIKNFVCLQSEGGATICESRQSSSLASFDITWKTDVLNVTTIVNDVLNIALSPTNMKIMSPIVQIGRSNMSNRGDVNNKLLTYLPPVSELSNIADDVVSGIETISFDRICSLCPLNYKTTHLLPIFVIAGIHWTTLRSLLRKLMHPVFCAKLPPTIASLKHVASAIVKLIKEIQPKGPYTLLGESLAGPIAVEIMSLLQHDGEVKVNLILLEAIPFDLTRQYEQSSRYIEKNLCEHLLSYYKTLREDDQIIENDEQFRNYVSLISKIIHNRTTLIRCHNPASVYLCGGGDVTAIKANDDEILKTIDTFEQTYNRELNLHVLKLATYKELISTDQTADIINSSVSFEW